MSRFLLNEKDKTNNEYLEKGFSKMKTRNLINTDFLSKETSNKKIDVNTKELEPDKAFSNPTVNQTEKKIEEYMGIIDLIESQVNNNEGYAANVLNTNVYKDSSENSTLTADRTSRFHRGDKRHNTFKNNYNENKDSFFTFKRLLEYDKDNQGDADHLLVLTDKPISAETDGETRVEMLLEKMICDKSLISDKIFSNSHIDDLLAQIYINLSPDAYKIMTEENPDEDLVFYFHNLVGYKNPDTTVKIKDRNSFLNDDLFNRKLKGNGNKNIIDKESLQDHKNNTNKNNNLDFIDFNFLERNRENLDNVINNIIRLKKWEPKSNVDSKNTPDGRLNESNQKQNSPEDLNYVKAIPLDLEVDTDFSEDKLIFEDEFREHLIHRNLKLMKTHQAELFTIPGNQDLKEILKEMKQRQMVDELLSVVGLEEMDPEGDIVQDDLEPEEKLKQNLMVDSEFNNNNKNNFYNEKNIDSYLNYNSHFKQESLYQYHNITMILKMSHSDDEDQKDDEENSENKNFNFNLNNKNNNSNNKYSNAPENNWFSNISRVDESKKAVHKKNSSEFNNEYNSNNLNQDIKDELNRRNNPNEMAHFNNNPKEQNLEEEPIKSRLDTSYDISNLNNIINTMNLNTNANINSTSIPNNNNNNNVNLNMNNFKDANFSPINDTGVKLNFGNFSPVLNTQKKSNMKKINFAEAENKSPIKQTNFAAEDNVFLYSLEKSAFDSKKKSSNKGVNRTKLNTSITSQASISNNRNAKKKGISIQDILEGNFNEDLINRKAQNRANSNNGSFERSRNNANPPPSNKLSSKANLIKLNDKNKDRSRENSISRVNGKGKVNVAAVQGRDNNYTNENKNKGVSSNMRIIPSGKNNKKSVKKEDDFFNDDW